METFSKKLGHNISQMQIIYLDSNKKLSLEKKLENYNKSNLLMSESHELIDNLQKEILNLDTNNPVKTPNSKINELIELLSNNNNNPKFDEVLYIVQQLQNISKGLPVTTQITDNVNQEVIYEEHIVE